MDQLDGNFVENREVITQYQADIFNAIFSYAECFALKSIIELRIPDMIHSHGQPMSLSQITSKINCSKTNHTLLSRVMNLLVRKKFFTVDRSQSTVDIFYGLAPKSKLLVRDHEMSVAPLILFLANPIAMGPRCEISGCIREGEIPFKKFHGKTMWEMASNEVAINKLFNDAMVSRNHVQIKNILISYEQEFGKMEGIIVDVGGGVGHTIAAIVKDHPHIKGINFDLPHVIHSAPQYPNVTQLAGDMFNEIPNADAIFMKAILHDWGDEECVKILKNCHKALKKCGKVIIVDIVLQPDEGNGAWEDIKACLDFEMAVSLGGKERTKQEWSILFEQANFTRHNIIDMPFYTSIIEAYP